MTDLTKRYLTNMYRAFGKREFRMNECSEYLRQKPATISFHIKKLEEYGLMKVNRHPGNAFGYEIKTSPEKDPECFIALGKADYLTKTLPKVASERRNAVAMVI